MIPLRSARYGAPSRLLVPRSARSNLSFTAESAWSRTRLPLPGKAHIMAADSMRREEIANGKDNSAHHLRWPQAFRVPGRTRRQTEGRRGGGDGDFRRE